MPRIHRRLTRRGSALVEAAMVLPIALLFLFSIFEYGRLIMCRQGLVNAAREGARWAVVHTHDGAPGGPTDASEVRKVVRRRLGSADGITPGILERQLTSVQINVFRTDSSDINIQFPDWTEASYGNLIGVEVTGNYTPVLPSFFLMTSLYNFQISMGSTIQLRGRALMTSEAN